MSSTDPFLPTMDFPIGSIHSSSFPSCQPNTTNLQPRLSFCVLVFRHTHFHSSSANVPGKRRSAPNICFTSVLSSSASPHMLPFWFDERLWHDLCVPRLHLPCEPQKKKPCARHLKRPTPPSGTPLLAQTAQPIPTTILDLHVAGAMPCTKC